MMRRLFIALPALSVLALSGCQTDGSGWQEAARSVIGASTFSHSASNLSTEQITAGLKEALNIGSGTVVSQLSKTGGFNLDPVIRIP